MRTVEKVTSICAVNCRDHRRAARQGQAGFYFGSGRKKKKK